MDLDELLATEDGLGWEQAVALGWDARRQAGVEATVRFLGMLAARANAELVRRRIREYGELGMLCPGVEHREDNVPPW